MLLLLFSSLVLAGETKLQKSSNSLPQAMSDWEIAIGSRTASIPYVVAENNSVSDFVPKMYFEGASLYLRG
jgi:outer membrane protein